MRLEGSARCFFRSSSDPVARLASCLTVLVALMISAPVAWASNEGDLAGRRIASVVVLQDQGQQDNATYRDAVLKAFAAHPGGQFDPSRSDLMLNQVRRLNFVKDARYVPRLGEGGDVELGGAGHLERCGQALEGCADGRVRQRRPG